jgi:hypothetical protein
MIWQAIIIGITAWVFTLILIEPDMIFYRYGELIRKLPDWLNKPLGICEYCLSGQLALWYYFTLGNYNLFYHIGFISVSIFTVKITNIIVYGNNRA